MKIGSFSKAFSDLVRNFSRFPGVGRRSAERIVFHMLRMKPEEVEKMADEMKEIHGQIKPCKLCNNFSTNEICSICSNPQRDKGIICVVEEPKDIMAIEKTSHYNGIYYVLLGSVSPIDGVDGEDLNLDNLVKKIESKTVKEVVIATDPDNEGELTAQYIIQKLSSYKVKIYRIAIGIPLGTQIEYIDSATLGKALLEKKPLT